MFDIGFWELSLIGIMALIVLGPERLPGAARTAGRMLGKARRMVTDIKRDLKDELDAAELADLKSVKADLEDATRSFKSNVESSMDEAKEAMSPMDEAIKNALDDPQSSAAKDMKTVAAADSDVKAATKPKPRTQKQQKPKKKSKAETKHDD